jgi:hypothetical protein
MWFIVSLLFAQAPQLLLPEGNGAWVVQINTTGGILGTGVGHIAVSSERKILCSAEMKCPNAFNLADIQPFVDTIQTPTLPLPPPASVSLCRDCVTRTIKIRWRDSIGVLHGYAVTFDETTKGNIPPDVARLYDAVVGLRK